MFFILRGCLCLFCVLLLPSLANAQDRVDLRTDATRILRELPPIDFSKFGTGEVSETAMLARVAKALGLEPDRGEGLSFLRRTDVPLTGLVTYHLEQRYDGIPVWGERVTITAKRTATRPRRLGGHALRQLGASGLKMRARLSPREALSRARRHAGVEAFQGSALLANNSARLVIYASRQRSRRQSDRSVVGSPILAYETSFFAFPAGKPVQLVTLIDARSGRILMSYDNLQHLGARGPGGNGKTGCYVYGRASLPVLPVTRLQGGQCALDSINVATWNCRQGKDLRKCKIHQFRCGSNAPKPVNGACGALNDAHFFGQVIFAMYRDWYGIRPLKKKLNMVVHVGEGLQNAFWNGKAMFFGDGGGKTYPFVVLDVAAHEVSHGFTAQHSGLIYKGQSGGINEAFSDMAGETMEAYFAEKYLRRRGSSAVAVFTQGQRRMQARAVNREAEIAALLSGNIRDDYSSTLSGNYANDNQYNKFWVFLPALRLQKPQLPFDPAFISMHPMPPPDIGQGGHNHARIEVAADDLVSRNVSHHAEQK